MSHARKTHLLKGFLRAHDAGEEHEDDAHNLHRRDDKHDDGQVERLKEERGCHGQGDDEHRDEGDIAHDIAARELRSSSADRLAASSSSRCGCRLCRRRLGLCDVPKRKCGISCEPAAKLALECGGAHRMRRASTYLSARLGPKVRFMR